jgi:nitroimidazol reductase NimA-like FMN-containing flavoprotein (pyridoxamine 5'-phosphate oxidase superfamily)
MIRVLETQECKHLLSKNYIGNLSYIFGEGPFIVPITYFFDAENNVIIGYSAEGHKIDAMRKNSNVALNISEIGNINHWKSVLVHGNFEELSGSTALAKLHQFSLGVKALIVNKELRKLDFISQFSSKISMDDIPIIFQINITKITGKIRAYTDER